MGRKQPSNNKPKVRYWVAEEEEELVDVLTEQAANGNRSDNSFKTSVWQLCADRLAASFPQPADERKEPTHVRSRWDLLKKHWTIEESIWDDYLEAHPEASRFRTKPFPLYDKLTPLCETIVARGDKVVRIRKAPNQATVESSVAEAQVVQPDELDKVANADDEDEEDDDDDDEEVAQPAKASRKCAPSHTPAPRKRARISGAHGLLAVADAVRELSEAMLVTPPAASTEASPARHERAIRMLEEEPDFSAEDRLTAIDLFVRNHRLGDSYLAFSNPSLRSRWLERQLQEEGARMEQVSQAALFSSAWSSSPVPGFDGQSSYSTVNTADNLPT
ncbi:hypothetical protein CALCODRAFT_443163 [Calocera cornea HHB12733]|uniref:Myb/SANT-like domain-containing protein n=1 Tax=Calocera cornea HHB12733 TaxID=1353952 RepID=A0A165CTD8_9BASI|nr:hypothetical protein CALCODRAFT_443163 [Calocera cornea HHB12733]